MFPYGHTKSHLENYDELVQNFIIKNAFVKNIFIFLGKKLYFITNYKILFLFYHYYYHYLYIDSDNNNR